MAAKKSNRSKKVKSNEQGEIDLSKITILNARDDLDSYDPAVVPVDQESAAEGDEESEGEYDFDTLKTIVEALLFVAPSPMTPAKLSRAIGGTSAKEVRQALKVLGEELNEIERSFELVEVAGGYQLMTRPEYEPYLRRFKKERDSARLSPAALESLAIIAYRQPILRADVENLRGVGCGPILRSLMEKRLVKITGRAEVLGRPALYATTPQFLDHFGLKSLADLPRSLEFKAS